MNNAAKCFDRDNKKYCPTSVWDSPSIPYTANPPFNFNEQKYETYPVYTIEKTKTQASVEGKANAAVYAENNEKGSNSGHTFVSDWEGSANVKT